MSEGLDRIEAEKAAVKEMGNPVETGVELDKIHRPKMPWGTISLIIVLSILSCTFQYFLNREYIKAGGDGYGMGRHIMFTATGILVMIGVCFCGLYKDSGPGQGTDAGVDPAAHTWKAVLWNYGE